jgi:dihydroorotase-like cyclic amidohydrolase
MSFDVLIRGATVVGTGAFAAWGGISGCQTMLPLLLSDGRGARGLSLELIAAATSGYVARLLIPKPTEMESQ